MQFRLGTEKDLPEIIELFEGAKQLMISQGILQWDEIYPTQEDYSADIMNQQLYIGEMDNKIVSTFVINKEADPQYENGRWNYKGDNWYIIHRLCVNANVQNQGIGTTTLKYIEELVRDKRAEAIRLDAFTQNPFCLSMYRKLGYLEVGFAQWRKGKFHLMEKEIR